MGRANLGWWRGRQVIWGGINSIKVFFKNSDGNLLLYTHTGEREKGVREKER